MQPDGSSDDYFASAPDSFAGRLAMRVGGGQRLRMYALFMEISAAGPTDRLLDVGVTSEDRYETNNFLEEQYPFKTNITAAGLSATNYLAIRYPGLNYVQITPGQPLPFADRTFDLVHASAVIEHVGSRAEQAAFLRELWRVCRRSLFVTTPNRWFPIEVHTVLPLIHWLPANMFRALLRRSRFSEWAQESRLNLLSSTSLLETGRSAGLENVDVRKVRLFGFTSNLALTASRASE